MVISNRIELLQQLFQKAQALTEQGQDLPTLVEKLEDFPKDFISIGYEAAAMQLATKDLQDNNGLNIWSVFLKNHAQKHAVQVHIGLGWALAQQRLSAIDYLDTLEPFLAWRILDGYGYYDSFFRRRKVLQGVLPDNINENALKVYSQGIGRSLWYLSKGNLEKLSELIITLPTTWRKDLWRGIGIASTYVGGGDEQHWKNLWHQAADFQPQLAAGSALAVKSRIDAHLQEFAPDNNSLLWCGLSPIQIADLLQQKRNELETAPSREKYHAWIEGIDKMFSYINT